MPCYDCTNEATLSCWNTEGVSAELCDDCAYAARYELPLREAVS